jgi:hypothetical protein
VRNSTGDELADEHCHAHRPGHHELLGLRRGHGRDGSRRRGGRPRGGGTGELLQLVGSLLHLFKCTALAVALPGGNLVAKLLHRLRKLFEHIRRAAQRLLHADHDEHGHQHHGQCRADRPRQMKALHSVDHGR